MTKIGFQANLEGHRLPVQPGIGPGQAAQLLQQQAHQGKALPEVPGSCHGDPVPAGSVLRLSGQELLDTVIPAVFPIEPVIAVKILGSLFVVQKLRRQLLTDGQIQSLIALQQD